MVVVQEEYISNKQLADYCVNLVESGIVNWRIIAELYNRERGFKSADSTGLKRKLGLLPTDKTHEYMTTISYEDAAFLIRALGLYPVDYGV